MSADYGCRNHKAYGVKVVPDTVRMVGTTGGATNTVTFSIYDFDGNEINDLIAVHLWPSVTAGGVVNAVTSVAATAPALILDATKTGMVHALVKHGSVVTYNADGAEAALFANISSSEGRVFSSNTMVFES